MDVVLQKNVNDDLFWNILLLLKLDRQLCFCKLFDDYKIPLQCDPQIQSFEKLLGVKILT